VVKFEGHFHGWHDHLALATHPPYDEENVHPGILDEVAGHTILCPPDNLSRLEGILKGGDVAAVIVEPTGATFGAIPTKGDFLRALREITSKHRTLLIFDEVITGFRCSPGGAQEYYQVTPDLTSLAKILAGGFPGGALVGKRSVMELLEFRDDDWNHRRKVPHQGTYNANPISASAGIATLKIISSGVEIERANSIAQKLRSELNKVAREHGIGWCVYGDFSAFHIYTNPGREKVAPEDIEAGRLDYRKLKNTPPPLVHKLRIAMLLNGVDISGWPGGMVSSAHTEEDVEKTARAFSSAISMLKEEGEV
jgi:glutamate-1-semialdehyde 2,1-aminomutase